MICLKMSSKRLLGKFLELHEGKFFEKQKTIHNIYLPGKEKAASYYL